MCNSVRKRSLNTTENHVDTFYSLKLYVSTTKTFINIMNEKPTGWGK
jgi:hypothetical protein